MIIKLKIIDPDYKCEHSTINIPISHYILFLFQIVTVTGTHLSAAHLSV